MNYIIHKADDLSDQIHTCRMHAHPDLPCGPECIICALAKHEANEAEVGKILRTRWEEQYRAEYERLCEKLVSDQLFYGISGYCPEENRMLSQEELAKFTSTDFRTRPAYLDAEYEPEQCGEDCPWHGLVTLGTEDSALTAADLEIAHLKLQLENEKGKVEEAVKLLYETLDHLEAVVPILDHATVLEKALDKAGVAVGNEHRNYDLLERIDWLVKAKELGWRRLDEMEQKVERLSSRVAGMQEVVDAAVTMCKGITPSVFPNSPLGRLQDAIKKWMKPVDAPSQKA